MATFLGNFCKNWVTFYSNFPITLTIIAISSDEDITYTNWGITSGAFEPIDDTSKLCASVCLGATCNGDNSWKAASCDVPKQFVCSVQCKFKMDRLPTTYDLYSSYVCSFQAML